MEKYIAIITVALVLLRELYHFYVKRTLTKEVNAVSKELVNEKLKNYGEESQKAKEEYEKAKSDYDSDSKP